MATLPTPGGDTDTWGDELNTYLLVGHTAGGANVVAASGVTASSATLVGTGTDVQAVVEELDNAIVAAEGATAAHLADTSAAHAASAISFSPTGTVAATDVQAAIAEVASEAGGGGGAPTDATYIVQTANGSLSAEQAMGALATGIVKNTTTSGVQSIAAAGTDYYAPGSTDVAVADGGTGSSTASAARTALGLAIGTDVAAQTHATQHKTGGSDSIALDTLAAPTDITTLNATTTAHGLVPKGDNNTAHFLNGQLAWATPAGGGSVATDVIFDAKGDLAVGTAADTAAKLTVGANDTVLTANSAATTGTNWVIPHGYTFAYAERTTDLAVTATVQASAQAVVTAASITFDGSTVIYIQFYCNGIGPSGANTLYLHLWEDSTDKGRICRVPSASDIPNVLSYGGFHRYTPAAGAKVLSVKAWADVTTGSPTINAGSGILPTFVRITKGT